MTYRETRRMSRDEIQKAAKWTAEQPRPAGLPLSEPHRVGPASETSGVFSDFWALMLVCLLVLFCFGCGDGGIEMPTSGIETPIGEYVRQKQGQGQPTPTPTPAPLAKPAWEEMATPTPKAVWVPQP